MDPGWDDPTDRRREYSVAVARLGGPRNPAGRRAALGLVVVGVLVAGGILSSTLFPTAPGAVPSLRADALASLPAPVGSASAPAALGPSSPAPAVPDPTGLMTPRDPGVSADLATLLAAIPRQGTGTLAFLSGRLHSTPRPCLQGAPLAECLRLVIDGLPGVPVVPDGAMTTWPGDPPTGETLVVLARGGKLILLGSVVADAAGIPRIDLLGARVAADPPAYEQRLPSLQEVDGMLLTGSAGCTASGPCHVGALALLAIPPPNPQAADSFDATAVQVRPGSFGIDARAAQTPGPFLVRWSSAQTPRSWQVVAREDQGSILHIVIP